MPARRPAGGRAWSARDGPCGRLIEGQVSLHVRDTRDARPSEIRIRIHRRTAYSNFVVQVR